MEMYFSLANVIFGSLWLPLEKSFPEHIWKSAMLAHFAITVLMTPHTFSIAALKIQPFN